MLRISEMAIGSIQFLIVFFIVLFGLVMLIRAILKALKK